jgi:S-adenosylmethionine uptake transporter
MSQTITVEARKGILFILAGMAAISLNDMLIKQLSGGYALHQIIFARASIALIFTLVLVQLEGGISILRTRNPILHGIRGLMLVISNMSFFVALSVMPLANVTALFFAAPLFITLLSIPLLGEKVGVMRMGAVVVGFVGVIIMQRPWEGGDSLDVDRIVLLMPLLAGLTYALNQIFTRKLGATTKAAALAVYVQGAFILVSVGFYAVAGDGGYAQGVDDPSLQFLLRAWIWPNTSDWYLLIGLGFNAAIIGYCLSQAYRLADAATIAPFEYIGLPLAVMWGWLIWADLPEWEVWLGMLLIMGAGLFVFLREQQKARQIARTGARGRY